MPRYKLLVLSKPFAGREDEYNDWYQNTHLDQVVDIPGFESAQRFRLARTLGHREVHPYAAIYEIETEDIDAVLRELERRAGGAQLMVSETIDTQSSIAAIYEEFGPVVGKDNRS